MEEIFNDINEERAPRISKRRIKEHLISHEKLAEVYNVNMKTLENDIKEFET